MNPNTNLQTLSHNPQTRNLKLSWLTANSNARDEHHGWRLSLPRPYTFCLGPPAGSPFGFPVHCSSLCIYYILYHKSVHICMYTYACVVPNASQNLHYLAYWVGGGGGRVQIRSGGVSSVPSYFWCVYRQLSQRNLLNHKCQTPES